MTPLVPHPSTPETAFGVAAGVERVAGGLRFAYRVVGDLTAATYVARSEGYELLGPATAGGPPGAGSVAGVP